jgi:hypothetical protein
MGEACGTHGRDEKYAQSFGRKTFREEELGRIRHRRNDDITVAHREIILNLWIGFIWFSIDQWQAFVNTVMNIRVSKCGESFD